MKVIVLGGPHDGAPSEIPEQMGEGQEFLIDKVQYYVHTPRDKPRQLIYYKVSQEF
jgi:hypothetical protein